MKNRLPLSLTIFLALAVLYGAMNILSGLFTRNAVDTGQLQMIAQEYKIKKQYAQAESVYMLAMSIIESEYGPDHPELVPLLISMSGIPGHGDTKQMIAVYQRVSDIYSKNYGAENTRILMFLPNLAYFLKVDGRYAEAESVLQRSLEIAEKNFGPDGTMVARSLNNMATLYIDQGRNEEAEPIVRRAIKISGKQYGAKSSTVAQSLNNLAQIYINQNQPALAESLYIRAIALMESTVKYNYSLWYHMSHLANLYVKQGRYGEAEPLYIRAMEIKKKVIGYETFNEKETLESLATLYRATDRDREADELDGLIQSISPRTR